MEAYLSENEGVLALDDDEFSEVELIDTELSIKDGRPSNKTDGRIDLLITYSQEYIGVVELKHGQLTSQSRTQLEDYLKENSRNNLLEKYSAALGEGLISNPKWIGVLVGSGIEPDLAAQLRAGYASSGTPIAALTIQRFRGSEGSVFVTTDVYFAKTGQARDYTKYVFEGETLRKNRLVLEVVKRFVQSNPAITFSQLKAKFPNDLQGNLGVFTTADKANEIYTETGFKRHFLKPSELVELKDSTIAVCTQWGVGNIEKLITHATTELNYCITKGTDS